MGQLFKLLWDAISGWLPLPEYRAEVAPYVFYPLFALLCALLAWGIFREQRESYQKAKSEGQAKVHVWTTIICVVVIGGIGWWFITG